MLGRIRSQIRIRLRMKRARNTVKCSTGVYINIFQKLHFGGTTIREQSEECSKNLLQYNVYIHQGGGGGNDGDLNWFDLHPPPGIDGESRIKEGRELRVALTV